LTEILYRTSHGGIIFYKTQHQSTASVDDIAPFRGFNQHILKASVLVIRKQIGKQAGECWRFDEFDGAVISANGV